MALQYSCMCWLKVSSTILELIGVQTIYNEPSWLFKKRIACLFSPKTFFSYKWILEQFFLHFVIINAYSCPNA
jgi:hypothetical protein